MLVIACVTEEEFAATREYHPSLAAVRRSRAGVLAVTAEIVGRRGGGTGFWFWGPRAARTYLVLADVSVIRFRIPDVWVLAPADAQLRHLNVFREAARSSAVPEWLQSVAGGPVRPRVCWGAFAEAWTAAPERSRTLGAALDFLVQLLNHQNPGSPAR